MAFQSFIWTALPNGLTPDGRGLRISVLVSPRLHPRADPAVLATFGPDWTDWPATLARATARIFYGGVPGVPIALNETVAADRVDTGLGVPDSTVWKALFHDQLPVHGFAFTDLSGKDVLSYDTVGVTGLVQDLYGKLAAAADGDRPTLTDFLDDPDWLHLAEAVAQIDRQLVDQKTGLRDPGREFEVFRHGGVDAPPMGRMLARLQLFHTPPTAAKPVTRTRTDDPRIDATYLEHEQPPLPDKADFAKKFDFHKVVAAMSSYPTVLRRLGLVVDLVVDRDRYTDHADSPLWVEVTFPAGALAVTRSAGDVSPRTHARLSGPTFAAHSNPLPPTAGQLRVPDGLLDLDPSRFALLEMDVDGIGLKLLNFARSLGRILVDQEQRVDPVTRFEREAGAPSLRTAGMMLVHQERAGALKATLAASKDKNDLAGPVLAGKPGALPPELWAEDVVRGFRFDVWDSSTGVWRSLCRREAVYEVGDGPVTVIPEAEGGEEEGIVRLAATTAPDTTSNPDLIWLHEAVVSWTGWSLVAPPPGRAIRGDDTVDTTEAKTEAELPPGLTFRSRYRAVRRSLPRLRFGRQYWIRARAVDLAGNALAPQDGDFGPEQPLLRAQPFLRYEPVLAPVVALVEPEGGTIETPAEGESMQRMAIRTFNDVPPDNLMPTGERARRFAVPPQVSAKDAEYHGVLDAAGLVDPTTFDLLANQKDFDATEPGAALVEAVLPLKGPLESVAVPTTFAVYRDGHALTYLPDPLAQVVSARIIGHPAIAPDDVIPIPLYADPGDRWPEARPFKVELVEDVAAPAPRFDAATRTLVVPLAKGDRATVRLSMQLSDDALRDVMGVWRWVSGPGDDQLRLALQGQNWLLTPWRTIDVVHAVQRPLVTPEILKLAIIRSTGATSSVPQFFATCGLTSTDRVDLRAEWHEPSDNPDAPESEAVEVDRHRGDTAFSVKITPVSEYAQRHLGHKRGGIADHVVVAPDVIEVGMVGHDLVASKTHEFHDTRYRRIEYWLEATTRFREYLPFALLVEDPVTDPTPTEEHVKVVGPRTVAWIPSSAPPPAPEVLYVVPTFGWVRSETEGGNASSWRRGGGIRVYLNRPWNASGYGEMLAVVLPPPSFGGDPETEPKGHPYKKMVTQWGNDPIWDSPFVPGIAPTRARFPLARKAGDPSGAWLPPGAPPEEADQPPGPFPVTGLSRASDPPVDIAPHDVFYDAERRLWYCDMEIDQGASYWPFVRLALARYQPVSLGGAHLSDVVLADFMPLVADRWLNVNRTSVARRRAVTVFGCTYRGSSGHDEASGAPSISFFNKLTGKVSVRRPAKVSATSVVEVWLERLDPALGEDFGWERVAGTAVQPTASPKGAPSATADSHFVLAPELARAHQLYEKREFGEMVSGGLIGAVIGCAPLWDGTVTLPTDPSPAERYRLVIAEYEEYLVDDDLPYDNIPTEKGRRLVFVEHVELT